MGFDEINSMTKYFKKRMEMNGSIYVKIPLRSSAILNIENDDRYCLPWSKLSSLHPCNKNHPNRISKYRQHFFESNIEGFDFSNDFKGSDFQKFEKLINLTTILFELNFSEIKINGNIH